MVCLGSPRWRDPERQQSIDRNISVKMEWRIKNILSGMTCWAVRAPAKICLTEAMVQLQILLEERNVDFWAGEANPPGCTWEPSMHGRSVRDAQPTIILSSTSRVFRRNADDIINDHDFKVDPRGIGIDYYSDGPCFYAGNSPSSNKPGAFSAGFEDETTIFLHSSQTLWDATTTGQRVLVGSATFTMGGLIAIDGKIFGLTVAHAFEPENIDPKVSNPSMSEASLNSSRDRIGSLYRKRPISNIDSQVKQDLDWAVCNLDSSQSYVPDRLPDTATRHPLNIIQEILCSAAVLVHTSTTGVIKGSILGDYSLVALPSRKRFQRMWTVILERALSPGDCGAWVLDATDGDLYGHIVAGKKGTGIAYIILARDIFKDISIEFGASRVTLPSETEFPALFPNRPQSEPSYYTLNYNQVSQSTTDAAPLTQLWPSMTSDLVSSQRETSRREQYTYNRPRMHGKTSVEDSEEMENAGASGAQREEEQKEWGELEVAADAGDTEKVRQLLELGTRRGAGSALYIGTVQQHVTIVQMLLDSKSCGNVARGEALRTAAGLGNAKIVQMLLKDQDWNDETLQAALREAKKWREEGIVNMVNEILGKKF